jgi:hypothetical protein
MAKSSPASVSYRNSDGCGLDGAQIIMAEETQLRFVKAVREQDFLAMADVSLLVISTCYESNGSTGSLAN